MKNKDLSNKFKLKLQLNDSDIKLLQDAKASKKEIKSLKVKIEASHSGIVNKNYWFYTPTGMADGADSFVKPYNKPVTVNHDPDLPPIGRVLESSYIDYSQYSTEIRSSRNYQEIVDQIVAFTNSKDFNQSGYKGLGHIELIAEITDKEAIQKILDKRYLTVSIGGNSDMAICSVCGNNLKDEKQAQECEHSRGGVFDNQLCFLIGGKMDFDHISYVSSPADENAMSEVINDSTNTDSFCTYTQNLSLLDYIVEDEKESLKKMDLTELLALFKNAQALKDKMAELGLSTYALSDEDYAKLRKSSFLFADSRTLPINDKAHIVTAFKLMNDVKDSEDKSAALDVLKRKFENAFGKNTSVEDALKELTKTTETKEAAAVVEDSTKTPALDLVALSDAIVSKVMDALKKEFSINDSYASQRANLLEQEVEALEDENKAILGKYKDMVINQILAIEDKLEDEGYRAKLAQRNLESLADKLEDLGFVYKAKPAESDANSQVNAENVDNGSKEDKEIKDSNIDINDASDDNGDLEDVNQSQASDNATEIKDGVEQLDISLIRDEYLKLIRSQGFKAARTYLKELSDAGKLPDNFTF